MADWATVGVAAITATAGVAGGYLGARRQGMSDLERMHGEHREGDRQRRAEMYQAFLDHLGVFSAVGDGEPMTFEEFRAWWGEFHHKANGIRSLRPSPSSSGSSAS